MRIEKLGSILKVIAGAFLIAVSSAGAAQAVETITVETFESGTNIGNWSWGTGSESFVIGGDAHGRYLREDHLVTFTPRASTDFGSLSIFTGDYRARNVTSVGIDLAIPFVSENVTGRTVTLILLNDNGTPAYLEDDWGAYTVTDLPIPPTGVAGITETTDMLQWSSYDIAVPSQSNALPEGWSWISRNYQRKSGAWGRLMRDVDHVGFIMGDPALRYPLMVWDVALDNPRVTTSQAQ